MYLYLCCDVTCAGAYGWSGNSKVLDIGCNQGDLINHLVEEKKCEVIGIDKNETSPTKKIMKFISYVRNIFS